MYNLKGSRILITGGAGFIGSHVIDVLLDRGVKEIIVLDNYVRGQKENVQNTSKVRLFDCDIRDRETLFPFFKGIDFCFHLAAMRINYCIAHPKEGIEVMINGTLNVIEACLNHQIKKIVAASSASIYGMADSFPTQETHHPYNNRTLYGACKLANEGMFRAFNETHALNYCMHRFFNVYGSRMDTDGKYTEVLIKWYKLIQEGKQPLIYGDGKQTMDFIHVKDVARACVLSVESSASDEVFNIGNETETSLSSLCEEFLKAMQSPLQPQYIPVPEKRKKCEVLRRKADTRKASTLLNFRPELDLKTGLKEMIDWLNGLKKSPT